MDNVFLCLERKQKLNKLRKNKNNDIYQRTLDVLTSEVELSVKESIEIKGIVDPIIEDNSTFEERLQKYLQEINNHDGPENENRNGS